MDSLTPAKPIGSAQQFLELHDKAIQAEGRILSGMDQLQKTINALGVLACRERDLSKAESALSNLMAITDFSNMPIGEQTALRDAITEYRTHRQALLDYQATHHQAGTDASPA